MRPGERTAECGYALVVLLAWLAVLGMTLAAAGSTWARSLQREREVELLRIGALYAQAIESFYQSAPGSLKEFPLEPAHLLRDPRFAGLVRHLRKLENDPLRPGQPLQYLRNSSNRIIGVASSSEEFAIRERWRSEGVAPVPYKQLHFLAPSAR